MNCDKCKKDWTKCATCSVMVQWVRENDKNRRKGEIRNESKGTCVGYSDEVIVLDGELND